MWTRRNLMVLTGVVCAACGVWTAAGQPSESEMAAMQAAMTPGEFHRRLDPLVGVFDVTARMWMDPSAPPTESQGTSENRWVLGGRFVEQHFRGEFMGMPFEGIGHFGYDNVLKKYVSSWIDSMGTGIMPAQGSLKGDGSIEFWAEYPDPMTGKMTKFRELFRIVDADHHTMEMFTLRDDGSEYRNMELHYRRRK